MSQHFSNSELWIIATVLGVALLTVYALFIFTMLTRRRLDRDIQQNNQFLDRLLDAVDRDAKT